jgi:hypothetical protein
LTGASYAHFFECTAARAFLASDASPPEERRRKLLISLNNDNCPFSRQANQGLDFQGLARWIQRLSTKLSTEILSKCHIFLQINDLPQFPQQ